MIVKKWRTWIISIFFLLVGAAEVSAESHLHTQQQTNSGTLIEETITHDGIPRSFLFYVPDNLVGTPALVFMLHGGGGTPQSTMETMTELRWNELADQEGFIVVYSEGIDNRWNDCRNDVEVQSQTDDVGFFAAQIDWFSAEYNIDTERVYAAGHSNGGMMSMRLAIELSDRIAAVFSTTGPLAAVSECSSPDNPIGVAYMPGTADPLIPYDGGALITPGGTNQGTVLSAESTSQFWRDFLQTNPIPQTNTYPNIVLTDGSTVTHYQYEDGVEGVAYWFLDVVGGGHGWPAPTQNPPFQQAIVGKKNQDVVAVDLAWEFFSNHRLSGETPISITLKNIDGQPDSSVAILLIILGLAVTGFVVRHLKQYDVEQRN